MPTRWRDAVWRRELASDDRAGRYARREVRRRYAETLGRAWKALALVLVLVPLGFVPLALTQSTEGAWFVMGLGVATALWLAVLVVLFMSGATGALNGMVAEQWTAAELRKLRRRGWRLVNGLVLEDKFDIDHVAVGPGGVLVVETKHSADVWPVGVSGDPFMVDRLQRACRQLRKNARQVRLVSAVGRAVAPAPVLAVLVVHSSSVGPAPGPPWDTDGDLTVVHGSSFREWLGTLDGHVLAPDRVEEAWSALADHAHRRDAWEAQHEGPLPLTAGQVVRRGVFGVPLGAFAGGVLHRRHRDVAWTVGADPRPGGVRRVRVVASAFSRFTVGGECVGPWGHGCVPRHRGDRRVGPRRLAARPVQVAAVRMGAAQPTGVKLVWQRDVPATVTSMTTR